VSAVYSASLTFYVRQSMKPRFVYIHGDGVLHWSWRWVTRLKQDLEAAGFTTFFETFPDSIEARSKYWLPFLKDHIGVGENDILVGWSCGAVAAMRFAQEHRVKGLALIAPYFTDLGLEAVRNSGFVDPGWDWHSIRERVNSIAMFFSDEDPYVSQAEFAELASNLRAKTFAIHGAGHFSDMETFPQLTDYLIQEYA